jgi:tetratricopeptide (TPR) repeat protein
LIRLFSTDSIEWRLRSWSTSSLLLLVIGLPSLLIAGAALRMGIASTLGESGSITDLRRALRVDPTNAELHRRLGMYDMYLADPPNAGEALAHLHRATELSPRAALYWSNLGSACESSGDNACADAAFERLLALDAMMPRYRWVVANYELRAGRPERAMEQFRRLLELSSDREYAERTFEVCLRALGDPETIFTNILAGRKDPALKLEFVDYLSEHDRLDDAHKVWVQTAASSGPFPFSLAKDYLARLLIQNRYQQALSVWQDLERLGIVTRPKGDDPSDLVFNGGFEAQPMNAGFDWHFAELPFLSLDLADPNAYRGARCLRVDFTVKRNELYQPVYQFLHVVPGEHYQLTAYVRSDNITSDTGPELRVFDPAHPENLDVSTETTVGTTAWHPISLTFQPGPDTAFVMLAVRRARSRSFPTEISGTFWVDAISVKPASRPSNVSKG